MVYSCCFFSLFLVNRTYASNNNTGTIYESININQIHSCSYNTLLSQYLLVSSYAIPFKILCMHFVFQKRKSEIMYDMSFWLDGDNMHIPSNNEFVTWYNVSSDKGILLLFQRCSLYFAVQYFAWEDVDNTHRSESKWIVIG